MKTYRKKCSRFSVFPSVKEAGTLSLSLFLLLALPLFIFYSRQQQEYRQYAAGSSPHLLWGMGDNISGAESTPMFRDAPMKMVTTWFNNPGDLGWISGHQNGSKVSDYYRKGYAMQLNIWLADYAQYAISPQFQKDVKVLAQTFKGNGPNYGTTYVTIFSEFETYPTNGDPNYFTKLKNSYLQAIQAIHQVNPKAYVGLGFGGYEWSGKTTTDISFWDDAIRASDIVAVQAMQDCANKNGLGGQNEIIPNLRNSVHQLGGYGKPVMISHFLLWGNDHACEINAFNAFRNDVLSPSSISALNKDGLFAFGFQNGGSAWYLRDPGTSYNTTKQVLTQYAATVTNGSYCCVR